MSRFLLSKRVKARKNHICDYCGLKINTGDQYTYAKIVSDDEYIHSWKSHLHCDKIVQKIDMFTKNDHEPITQSDFIEHVGVEYDDICFDHNLVEVDSTWEGRLKFVLEYHNIQNNIDSNILLQPNKKPKMKPTIIREDKKYDPETYVATLSEKDQKDLFNYLYNRELRDQELYEQAQKKKVVVIDECDTKNTPPIPRSIYSHCKYGCKNKPY